MAEKLTVPDAARDYVNSEENGEQYNFRRNLDSLEPLIRRAQGVQNQNATEIVTQNEVYRALARLREKDITVFKKILGDIHPSSFESFLKEVEDFISAKSGGPKLAKLQFPDAMREIEQVLGSKTNQ